MHHLAQQHGATETWGCEDRRRRPSTASHSHWRASRHSRPCCPMRDRQLRLACLAANRKTLPASCLSLLLPGFTASAMMLRRAAAARRRALADRGGCHADVDGCFSTSPLPPSAPLHEGVAHPLRVSRLDARTIQPSSENKEGLPATHCITLITPRGNDVSRQRQRGLKSSSQCLLCC